MSGPVQLREAFTAQSQVLKDLLYNGSHLYIPSYQRSYNWKKINIEKLIWDFIEGIELQQQKQSFTFIGSLISAPAPEDAIEPSKLGETPQGVRLVIDGQQRLTTILIIFMVLRNLLEITFKELKDANLDKSTMEYQWIEEKFVDTTELLRGSLVTRKAPHQGKEVNFPRMIRAFEDMWAKSSDEHQYTSPLAKQIHEFSNSMNMHSLFTPSNPGAGAMKPHRDFNSHIELIQKIFISLKNGKNPETDELFLAENQTIEILKVVQRLGLQPEAIDLNSKHLDPKQINDAYFGLMRLLIISQYILSCVTVAHIECKDEEYAFAVFQSLNTTGLPLNSIETLVPEVIRAVGSRDYANSVERKNLDVVLEYMKNRDSTSIAGNLVISFALAESGAKLSTAISDQKQYLQKEFRKSISNDIARSSFIKRLRDVVDVDNAFRNGTHLVVSEIKEAQADGTALVFAFLKSLKHSIALGPINRFYNQAVISENAKQTNEFVEALWAVASFSCIWRATHDGTAAIDSKYRSIMNGNFDENAIGLAKTFRSVPDVSELRKAFIKILNDDGIRNRSDFVKRAEFINQYKNTPVAKLLLLASHENSTADLASKGLIKHAGRDLKLNYVSVNTWNSIDFGTIEHIAPNSPTEKWKQSGIYDDSRLVNSLGNFILVSQTLNSSFGNRDWDIKKVLYQALAMDDAEEAENMLQDLPEDLVGPATAALMLRQSEQPQFKSLGTCIEFDLDFLKLRNIRLLELAYDYLIKHLQNG